jgi:hypothetical protein
VQGLTVVDAVNSSALSLCSRQDGARDQLSVPNNTDSRQFIQDLPVNGMELPAAKAEVCRRVFQ